MARVAKPRQAPGAPRSIPAPANAPRRKTPHRGWLLATTALLPIAAGPVKAQTMPAPNAAPTGGQVVAGQAAIGRTANTTTITQSTGRAAIDWQQFNVGSQHTVQFVQPGQSAWTLNRVVTPDPSVIAGRVQANGGVAIINQSGVLFAQGAQVNVGSLIASASGITNENFMAGRMVFDQAARPGARVENRGSITVADRGLAALVAPGVANSGVIRARLGRVALGAAETFVLDLAGDGLIGIDVTQAVRTAPEGGQALVTNSGVIEAQGGSVLITAHAASGLVEDLVRHSGTIDVRGAGGPAGQVALRAQGGGVRMEGTVDASAGAGQRGGSVALQATGGVTVAGTARIDASGGAGGGRVLVGTTGRGRDQRMAARTTIERGAVVRADATQNGAGGEILVNSTDSTDMRGTLSARGGAQGGNGGFVEVSGQQALLISGFIDLAAPSGTPGELLIDPQNIIVSDANNPGVPGGETVVGPPATTPGDSFTATTGAATEWLQVEPGAITGFNGTVTLQASRDIIVEDAVTKASGQGGLGLLAGRNLTIGAAISVDGALTLAGTTGSIALGADLRATSVTMTAGTGINQTAGTIRHRAGAGTALTLAATTAAGDIAFNQTGNGALSVTFAAPGAVAIRSGNASPGPSAVDGALTVAGDSSGGSVLLASERANAGSTAGTLTLDAAVTSAAGITLHADGDITQNAAGALITARDATGILTIRGRTGGASAAASATLDAAANQVAVLDARTTGALAVSSIGFAAGPGDVPPANPTLSVTLAEGASIALAAPRLALPTGATAASGGVTLVATEAGGGTGSTATLTIGGAVTAGNGASVRLRADRMDLTGASFDATGAGNALALLEVGPLTAGRAVAWGGTDGSSLFLDTGSRAAIAGADTTTLRLGQTTVNAAAITAGGIDFGADLTIAGTLALHGTGAVTQGAGILDVPTLVLRGATASTGAGSVSLGTTTNTIDALDAISVAGLAVASNAPTFTIAGATGTNVTLYASSGALALGTAVVSGSGTVSLAAQTNITQGATGSLTAANLQAVAVGNISLTGSGNAIGGIVTGVTAIGGDGPLLTNTSRGVFAGGTFALSTSGALSITGAVESRTGGVNITAGSIAINAPIAVSGGATPTLRLVADGSGGASGNILQGSQVLLSPAGALGVTATGTVALSDSTNRIPTLLSSSATGSFILATQGNLTVSGPVAVAASGAPAGSDMLQLLSYGGALAINGALTTAGTGRINMFGQSISLSALVRPRDAAATTGGLVTMTTNAAGTSITQSAGGRIVTENLLVSTNGDATLQAGQAIGAAGSPASWNAISTVIVDVVGSFGLLNAGPLLFQGTVFSNAPGSSTNIVTTGALTLDSGSQLQTGTVSLAAGNGISILGTLGWSGTTRVTLSTNAGGTITQDGASVVNADTLRIIAGGDVALASANNVIDSVSAAALSADVGINLRSSVALTVAGPGGTMLLPNNTFAATPDGIVSNDIMLQAPSITINAPLQRFDTNQTGNVTLIADTITYGPGIEIDIGPNGVFGIGFENPAIEILVGDPVVDTIPAAPFFGQTYVASAMPVVGPLTQWISGNYINTLPLSASSTNATLRIGSPGQTARTFVIGPLTPDARFTTFDLLGGNVVIGANVSVPGRTVNISAGANVLAADTYLRNEVRGTYQFVNFFLDWVYSPVPNVPYVQANGVITAGTLNVRAGTGNVALGAVAHNVDALSGSAAGTFTFRDATGFQIGPAGSGGIAAGTFVALQADAGSITQAAGSPVVTPRLEIQAAGGAAMLDGGSPTSSGTDLNRIDRLTQGVFADFEGRDGLTLRNAGSLVLDANLRATSGNVVLHVETGNITQTGNGLVNPADVRLITAQGLQVSAPAGSVFLDNGGAPVTNTDIFANVITGGLGASTVAGDFVLRTATDLNITGTVLVGSAAGGTHGEAIFVSRFGSIIQQGGARIAADDLRAITPGGSLLFNGAAANSIGTVLASTVGTDFRLRSDRALTVADNIAAGTGAGTIELEGPGITLGLGGSGGTLTANTVLLRTGAEFLPATGTAGGPSIIQTAGTIEAARFSASAPGGDITFAAPGNTFGTIVAGADATGAVAAAGIVAGGNVTLTADGTTALGVASPIQAGWDATRADATITLTADNMALNALIDTRGPGSTDRQTGTIAIAPLNASGSIVLGGVTEYNGLLTLQQNEVANLRAGTVTVTTDAPSSQGLFLDTASLSGLMTGGTLLDLSGGAGVVMQFGGPLSVERLHVTTNNAVTLANAANMIDEVTGLTARGNIALTSASPLLTLSGLVRSTLGASTITIRANDLAIPAGGGITGANSTIDIAGVANGRAISLGTELANTLGLSSAEIGRIGESTASAFLVRIGTAASGTITLQGDVPFRDVPGDVSGPISGERVRTLELRSAGDIVQNGAGGINVATLSAAARAVSLHSADNAVDSISALTSTAGEAALRSRRDLVLPAGTIASAAGGTLAITSDASLRMQGSASASGATGDVELTGRIALAIDQAAVVAAARDVVLTSGPVTGNGVADLTSMGLISAGGSITATATGALTVFQDMAAAGGNITLRTIQPGTQPAADIVISAPLNLTVNLAPGVAGVTELRAASGAVILDATGNIRQEATGTQIISPTLSATAGGNVDLGVGGNQVTTLQSLTAADFATVAVAGALLVNGAATAADTISLQAGTTLTVSATGSVTATNAGGVVNLTAGTGLTMGGSVSGEDVNLTATLGQVAISGTVTGGGAGTGGAVTLAGSSILVNGGASVTAETITGALTTGPITIDASTVTALGAAGVLSLTTGGATLGQGTVSVTNATLGGATTTLAAGAGGLAISGTGLTAGAGGASLSALGAASITGGTTTVTGGGALALSGATGVTVNGGTHEAGGDVTLTSSGGPALVQNGTVRSTGGDVTLSGITATVATATLDAADALAVTATAGAAGVSGSTLLAGAGGATIAATGGTATITGGTTTVTGGGALALSGATGVTVNGGTHAAGGDVTLTSSGGPALVQNGTVRSTGGDVTLSGITATVATATLDAADALAVTATAGAAGVSGSTLLAGAGGATIAATGGTATITGGTTTVTGGGALALSGTSGASIAGGIHTAAGTVSLTSSGGQALIQNAGVNSTGGDVTVSGQVATIIGGMTTADGTIGLTATTGAASVTAGALTAGADISLTGTTLAQVSGGVHQADGNVTLSAAAATLSTTVSAGGDVSLAASAGNAIVTGGAVTAGGDIIVQGQALARITGGTHIAADGVQVTSAGGPAEVVGTTLTVTTGTVALTGTSALIDAATLSAGDSVTLTGLAGPATISGGAVTAVGNIALQGQLGASVSNGAHTAGGDFTIAALTGTAQASTTTLAANAGTLSITGPAVAMNAATLSAGTAIAMAATGGDVTTTNGSLTSGGAITLQAAGLATLDGTQSVAAGATTISGNAGVRLAGGSHNAALGFTANSAAGTAELTGTAIASGAAAPISISGTGVTLSGGALAAGGEMTVTASAGNLLLDAPGLTAGGNMTLSALGGALTFQTGTTAQASADIAILAGGLAVAPATLSAGRDILMSVGVGGASFTNATLSAARDIRLTAGSATAISGGKFDAQREVILEAAAFTFNQANIDPVNIYVTASGNILIDTSSFSADEIIRIMAGGTLTVRNSTITGNSVGFSSGGALLLDGGLYVIGDVLAFASPTSIATAPDGMIVVTPRGALLPGVAFDTRTAGSLPDPLDVILPDNPLLPDNQQATQVRVPGSNSPGAFGAPDSDPAGTLDFSINAGRSALFLLIDGGNATGTIETAGRVGVFGLGGTVDLTGTLIDHNGTLLTGGAASALTESARPGPSDQLTRFRFNGCVISSINCFIPTQIVTIPQAPPQQLDLRLWGSRITDPDVQIPNVAEEDY